MFSRAVLSPIMTLCAYRLADALAFTAILGKRRNVTWRHIAVACSVMYQAVYSDMRRYTVGCFRTVKDKVVDVHVLCLCCSRRHRS